MLLLSIQKHVSISTIPSCSSRFPRKHLQPLQSGLPRAPAAAAHAAVYGPARPRLTSAAPAPGSGLTAFRALGTPPRLPRTAPPRAAADGALKLQPPGPGRSRASSQRPTTALRGATEPGALPALPCPPHNRHAPTPPPLTMVAPLPRAAPSSNTPQRRAPSCDCATRAAPPLRRTAAFPLAGAEEVLLCGLIGAERMIDGRADRSAGESSGGSGAAHRRQSEREPRAGRMERGAVRELAARLGLGEPRVVRYRGAGLGSKEGVAGGACPACTGPGTRGITRTRLRCHLRVTAVFCRKAEEYLRLSQVKCAGLTAHVTATGLAVMCLELAARCAKHPAAKVSASRGSLPYRRRNSF